MWHLKPASHDVFVNQRGGSRTNMAVYDLKAITSWPLIIRAVYKHRSIYGIVPQPLIHATRFIGGISLIYSDVSSYIGSDEIC